MKRLAIIALALGALGLVVTAVGVATDTVGASAAFLVAYTFWLTLVLGALVFVLMGHAVRMRWLVVPRRFAELVTLSLPVLAVLLVPLFVFAKYLYPWAFVGNDLGSMAQEVLHHRRGYLNLPFGVVRAAVCFGFWLWVAERLNALQAKLDNTPSLDLVQRSSRLAAVALPLFSLTLTMASFDWLMVLDATYFSTAFGVYIFAGGFLGALAMLGALMQGALRSHTQDVNNALKPAHFSAMGRLMLAFTVFWIYIAYCQFFLAWMADLPEEVPYYIVRMSATWTPLAWALVALGFVVPFFLLLPRLAKRRPNYVATVAALVLFAHYLDAYWLVMPSVTPDHALPTVWHLSAFVGVGGLTLGLAAWRAQSRLWVPCHDPQLGAALRYEAP